MARYLGGVAVSDSPPLARTGQLDQTDRRSGSGAAVTSRTVQRPSSIPCVVGSPRAGNVLREGYRPERPAALAWGSRRRESVVLLARALARRRCGEGVRGGATPVGRNARRSQPRPPGELARARDERPGGSALSRGGLSSVVAADHRAHHFQPVGAVYVASGESCMTAAAPRRRTPTPNDWA